MLPILAAMAASAASSAASGSGGGGSFTSKLPGATVPLALGQAIYNAVPTKLDKYNKEQLAKLQRLERAGQLGLTDAQRTSRERDLLDPVRSAATSAANQQARLLAQSAGGISAGDLAHASAGIQRQLGDAAMQVQSSLDQQSEAKKAAQQAEIDSRMAFREQRRTDRVNHLFSALSESAAAGGQMAGQAPEFARAAKAFGGARFDPQKTYQGLVGSGVPDNLSRAAQEILSSPDGGNIMQQAVAGENLDDPRVRFMRGLVVDGQLNQQMSSASGGWDTSTSLMNQMYGNATPSGSP